MSSKPEAEPARPSRRRRLHQIGGAAAVLAVTLSCGVLIGYRYHASRAEGQITLVGAVLSGQQESTQVRWTVANFDARPATADSLLIDGKPEEADSTVIVGKAVTVIATAVDCTGSAPPQLTLGITAADDKKQTFGYLIEAESWDAACRSQTPANR